MLRHLDNSSHPDLLVGTGTGDDAAVWQLSEGRALVSTADFFTPIVDDARIWGRIAATNAASDVYAMGGRPLFGLNLVAWPRDELSLDLLGEVMAGGQDAAQAGGWVVAGGHTVDGPEPMYGQALTGEVDPAHMLTNATARAGDTLILTKPLGTGILATAVKRCEPLDVATGGRFEATYRAGVTEMSRLNDIASRVAVAAGATGGTDITGFGLLGHLHKMAEASNVQARVHVDAVPLLPGIRTLLDEGYIPGGTTRNVEYVNEVVRGGTAEEHILLADAQTSGGLLFGCAPDQVALALAELADSGHDAAAIGELFDGDAGLITLS